MEKNGKNGGKTKKKTGDYSGHYVIASSRLAERRMLECRTLVPKSTLVRPDWGKKWTNLKYTHPWSGGQLANG